MPKPSIKGLHVPDEDAVTLQPDPPVLPRHLAHHASVGALSFWRTECIMSGREVVTRSCAQKAAEEDAKRVAEEYKQAVENAK